MSLFLVSVNNRYATAPFRFSDDEPPIPYEQPLKELVAFLRGERKQQAFKFSERWSNKATFDREDVVIQISFQRKNGKIQSGTLTVKFLD